MELEERLAALEAEFSRLTAKQMATEAALGTLANFIKRDPLLTEHILNMASDQQACAMQQGGNIPVLLQAFLEEIDAWHDRLRESENTQESMEK